MCTPPTHDPNQQPDPGVFSRRDGIKAHLRRCQLADTAPKVFSGTLHIVNSQTGHFVAATGAQYRIVVHGELYGLVRYLRSAIPTIDETPGGGFRLCQGFAVIEAIAPGETISRFLLVDWPLAKSAIEQLEERFGRLTRATPARGTPASTATAVA